MALPELAISRLGGDVAVDFFNTVAWRLDPARRCEHLTSYLHVLAWIRQRQLLTQDQADTLEALADARGDDAAQELAAILALRDGTYAALNGERGFDALERETTSAHAASRLVPGSDGAWHWSPVQTDLATPRHLLTLEFERLVTSGSIARFHRCEDRHCGWVFLDTSRQHNRRWCSSADCGNRNRVRAHYARAKA